MSKRFQQQHFMLNCSTIDAFPHSHRRMNSIPSAHTNITPKIRIMDQIQTFSMDEQPQAGKITRQSLHVQSLKVNHPLVAFNVWS